VKISLNWIKDYVNLDGINIRDIWNKFTMATAEVDDIIEIGKDINKVVVAKIVKVTPHPDSQKLTIVQVDTGAGIVQSVCGAPNVGENTYIPFAKIGGSIKKVAEVRKSIISGVESNGIICSAAEIGISDNHEGVLILEGTYTPGADIRQVIEIDDIVAEIDNKSLTNRPDLWGHYGIARELAALFKKPLKSMEVATLAESNGLSALDVKIEDSEKCYRYSGLVIGNIKVKLTPLKMQVRLYYCGMRSISPIVDLTNYLMLEVGQPMHAFDRRFTKKIVVASTTQSEKFITLDGLERDIPPNVLMIYNQEKPVALAGIMGGADSEVSPDTDAIVLESANFEGSLIRKSSTKIGLRTEASARFEKMLDPNLTVVAIKRFVKLLQDMQPDIKLVSSLTDRYPVQLKPITITVDKAYIDRYIGNIIDHATVVSILKSLEFGVKQAGDLFTVSVPSFRSTKDITMKVDIIEEITRIYGYDNIKPQTIDIALKSLNYNEELLDNNKIKEILAEKFAYNELNSYVWYDHTVNASLGLKPESKVRILNPHSKDMDTLRNSIAPIMFGFALKNAKIYDKINIFEIGSVFSAANEKSQSAQFKNLCILTGDKLRDEDSLFYELKGIATYLFQLIKKVEPHFTDDEAINAGWIHPTKATSISYSGQNLGYISVVHPQVKQRIDKKLNLAVLELNLSALKTIKERSIKYDEPSKYPEVNLDFSFLVDRDVSFARIDSHISEYQNDLLRGYKFLYLFTGKGLPDEQKSMTFRLKIGSSDKTLANDEIEIFTKDFLDFMESQGYKLR